MALDNILSIGVRMSDDKLTFGQQLKRWMDACDGMSNRRLARALGMSATHVGYLLADLNPATGKPIQVKRELAERIADALGVPSDEVKEAAGFGTFAPADASSNLDEDGLRLLRYFSELPQECQLDVLALTEALWRRRRVEGRAEKLNSITSIARPAPRPKEDADEQIESPRKKRRA